MASFLRTIQSVTSTVNKIGSAVNAFANFPSTVKKTLQDFTDPISFSKLTRLQGLPTGAEYNTSITQVGSYSASPRTSGSDWRVRIELPRLDEYRGSSVFSPLMQSNASMVFPTTPQIMVSHSANYNVIAPTHTNYPYPTYVNSSVEDITVTAEWPVENEADGRYWIASVHFLRSITKMFYGSSTNLGAPPPVVNFYGYGDFVFNQVPVVVKLFSLDLPDSVDYIKVPIGGGFSTDDSSSSYSYVPTLSRLNVTLSPAFSRDETRQFNLDKFTKGHYIGRNEGWL